MKSGEPFTPGEVLVVSKGTRYEFEKSQLPEDASEEDLREHLTSKGSDYDTIRLRYDIHRQSLAEIVGTLTGIGAKPKIVRAQNYGQDDLEGKNFAISLGGDGTFLDLASNVTNGILTWGINTDPERSEGALLPTHAQNFERDLSRICKGEYQVMERSRIKVSFYNGEEEERVEADKYALNDILVAEKSPKASMYFMMSLDGGPFERQKNSGLIVTMGTGSTAWYLNAAKLYPEQVEKVLAIEREMYGEGLARKLADQLAPQYQGDRTELYDTILATIMTPPSDDEIQAITQRYMEGIPFDPESNEMRFWTREAIMNRVLANSKPSGSAKEMTIWSRGWNAYLVIDGNSEYEFPNGMKAVLETAEGKELKTVCFS